MNSLHTPAHRTVRPHLAVLAVATIALFFVPSCQWSKPATTTQPVPVASVSVAPTSASIAVGSTVSLIATPDDASGNVLKDRAVSWSSDNTSVATVSSIGVVTGVATGSANVKATCEGQNASSAITVTATAAPVATVSVSPSSATLAPGASKQLTATAKDASGNTLGGRLVTWSSDNTTVASVSGSGLVVALAAGTANITATCEGKTGSSAITVAVVPVASVSVTPGSATITAGSSVTLTATPKDAGGNTLSGRTITWSSDNTAAATVNSSGQVSGVAAGTANVTATCEGKTGSSAITVSASSGTATLVGAGDIGCGGCAQDQTAALINSIPGQVFAAGDNAYENGTYSEYMSNYDPTWGAFKSRTAPCPGNHEYNTSPATGYFQYFGSIAGPANQGYYSFDLNGWHIISLDSEIDLSSGGAEVTWLRSDLAAHSTQCTIAFWHRPRWSSGDIHGDQPDVQQLWQALSDYKCEIVLAGHEHDYQRYEPLDANGNASATGIREFVVGTGGANLYSITTPSSHLKAWNTNTYGVLKLTLGNGTYSWQFIPVAGSTYTDSGSGTCNK